ncbi:hypothetical protein D3C73_1598730 [compost metagenome]
MDWREARILRREHSSEWYFVSVLFCSTDWGVCGIVANGQEGSGYAEPAGAVRAINGIHRESGTFIYRYAEI